MPPRLIESSGAVEAIAAVRARVDADADVHAAARAAHRPLIVVDTVDVGGAGKVVLQSARGLLASGVPVTLANFRYPGRSRGFDEAATASGAEFVSLHQAHRGDFTCIDTLSAAARDRGAALVESHSFKAHVVAWRVASRLGLPWLAYVHGWTAESRRVRLYNLVERQLLRRADHVCAVAPSLEAVLRAAGRRGPVTVLRNALDPSPSPPAADERMSARAALGVAPDEWLLVAVGRLSREKGIDVLLEAVARARLVTPALRLAIAGDGPERDALRARAVALGVDSAIAWLGSRRDVRDVYAAADAVVIPSRSEGLPNVALEAADAAVPLIATRVGALPDVVVDGCGWLVPPADVGALAAALVDAARAPDRADRGARLRRHVLGEFSAERRLSALRELHARVVAAGAGR